MSEKNEATESTQSEVNRLEAEYRRLLADRDSIWKVVERMQKIRWLLLQLQQLLRHILNGSDINLIQKAYRRQ